MTDQPAKAAQFPPRAWTYKYIREGFGKSRIEETFFNYNYPGNMIEYLSLEEHNALLAAERAKVRLAVKGALAMVCLASDKDHAINVLEKTIAEIDAAGDWNL